MKKIVSSIIMLVLTVIIFTNAGFAVTTTITEYIKSNGVSLQKIPSDVEGKVTLTGETVNSLIKILIIKDDIQRWYEVKLVDGKFNEEIWLIDGKGKYQVSVLVHKKDRVYTFGPTVFVENTVEVNRFTVPTLHVESNNEDIIALAQELTKDAKTDREKAENIYNWVVNNIRYDYDKYLRQINKNFDNIYGALNTLETKKGVCYDYSALVAALGRASGLQVKMIKGNFIGTYGNELHAWNEIYISEEKRWINVDSTFGSTLRTSYFDNRDFNKNHEKLEEY
ncbi:transglutaminase-like domain-containing protein [Acetivibrio straminisolvens]|jgi:transglutaminase-like putative cysteine protease|uniref:Transglutaminase-like enzyme n=1 Tax=Acetivibrio straminisolvens JCM 21531 TaxID=1294263 RepID=W4V8X8_9FIRM|nr:transglutaminase-like domain-containing protein [Acetivibrio straminisolvens]GAE89611.1 transglutaminase-like enzyme [Acetivibrio straminisolvens JCM 21531]